MRGTHANNFPRTLSAGDRVGCALFHTGQRQADFPHSVEVDCALGMGGSDYRQPQEPFQDRLLQLRYSALACEVFVKKASPERP